MPLISDFPTNDRIIDGKDMMDDAKMIGITPAVFTFSGIDVYKRQPSTRWKLQIT